MRAVSAAWFRTRGVFECDIADRRSVAVLCMLYKIRRNPMHPFDDALHGPFVPVRVTCGTLVALTRLVDRRAIMPSVTEVSVAKLALWYALMFEALSRWLG